MACLDTSTLIDLSYQQRTGRPLLAALTVAQLAEAGERLVTTRFNLAEIYVGFERAKDPARDRARMAPVLLRLAIIDFDDRAARAFGQVSAHLMRIGLPIGDMDVLVASTALIAGETLVTGNPQHFGRIPGLRVIGY